MYLLPSMMLSMNFTSVMHVSFYTHLIMMHILPLCSIDVPLSVAAKADYTNVKLNPLKTKVPLQYILLL